MGAGGYQPQCPFSFLWVREFFVLHRMVGRTQRGVLTPGYFEPSNFPSGSLGPAEDYPLRLVTRSRRKSPRWKAPTCLALGFFPVSLSAPLSLPSLDHCAVLTNVSHESTGCDGANSFSQVNKLTAIRLKRTQNASCCLPSGFQRHCSTPAFANLH